MISVAQVSKATLTFVATCAAFSVCAESSFEFGERWNEIEVRSTISVLLTGREPISIDIFWCADGGASSMYRAASIAGVISGFANASKEEVAQAITKVRTRQVSQDLSGSPEFPFQGTRYVYSADERSELKPLMDLLDPLLPVRINERFERAVPPGQLRIEVCDQPLPSNSTTFLYFQVPDSYSIDGALSARSFLTERFSGLSVAKGIDVVESGFPSYPEVRYFFPEDQNVAADVSAALSEQLGTRVIPKYVQGYSSSASPGSIEAWIDFRGVAP